MVSREYENIVYRDYIGIIFPSSLLTTSKLGSWKGFEFRVQGSRVEDLLVTGLEGFGFKAWV